jgi:hypothetical protein
MLAGVPPLWVQLIEAPWPAQAALSLRRLTNSGGKLPPSVIRRMRELFPAADIYSMYGLTEAFRSTYLDPALLDTHLESIGTAIPFAEVMVVRPDGSEAEAGEEGELVHAGPLVAKGYWKDPARTAERFKPAPPASLYGGMAVWSGDRVRRDVDALLYFVGRADGMIKTAGNRVSPTEVEEAAIASGLVAEAVALGTPDPRLGRRSHWSPARPTHRTRSSCARTSSGMLPEFHAARGDPVAQGAAAQSQRQDRPQRARGGADRMTKPIGPIPPGFSSDSEGRLLIGGRRVEDLARRRAARRSSSTTSALIDAKVARFRAAVAGVDLHYAMKANPYADVLKHLINQVDGIDLASGGELDIALGRRARAARS